MKKSKKSARSSVKSTQKGRYDRYRRARILGKPVRLSVHPALINRGSLSSFSKPRSKVGPSTSLRSKRHTTIRLYHPSLTKKTVKCKSEIADSARRHAFFRARAKGGSARPVHNRKHDRSC